MQSARLWLPAPLVAVLVISGASSATASTIDYSFETVVTTGPLSGTYSGTFSFDSSIISPGNRVDGADLLTSLDFNFDGTTYGAGAANTGSLTFAADGSLRDFLFGTACQADQCFGNTIPPHVVSWIATPGTDGFSYYDINSLELGIGNLTFQPITVVPIPSTLPLFATVLGALSFLGWSRNRDRCDAHSG